MLTSTELTLDLQHLGVGQGDLLMVHVAMRRIGPLEGGAAALVASLTEAVGAAGTLLVNVGVDDPYGWVNQRPEPERAALLLGTPPFDALLARADPDNGIFAEIFRTSPGTLVSDHPEGRFAARGARAAELLANVPWNDYYAADSPLERLTQRGGKVLRLGADCNTVTLIHYAEHLVDLPNKRRVRRHRVVQGSAGPELRVVETLDDSDGIAPYAGEDYFGDILQDYLATGRARRGRVGNADSELFAAADLVDFAVAWMASHLRGSKRREGAG